jgi:hypothetical protein
MNTEIPDPPEEPLDTLLREQVAYVEDGGFTRRVVESLPRRRRDLVRTIVLLTASAIGVALAIWWLPGENLPPLDAPSLVSQGSQTLAPWVLAFTVWFSIAWVVANALKGEVDLF